MDIGRTQHGEIPEIAEGVRNGIWAAGKARDQAAEVLDIPKGSL